MTELKKIRNNEDPFNDGYEFIKDFCYGDIEEGDYVTIRKNLQPDQAYSHGYVCNGDSVIFSRPTEGKVCHAGETAMVVGIYHGTGAKERRDPAQFFLRGIPNNLGPWPCGMFSGLYKKNESRKKCLKRKGKKPRLNSSINFIGETIGIKK